MNARAAAAEILSAVTDRGRTLDDALSQTARFTRLTGRDRAFARAIATSALRRLGGLDALLARRLARPLDTAPAPARALLRIGAAQILAMHSPAHAAVGETVAAARVIAPKVSGLINAVLRRVADEPIGALDALPPGADLPPWLMTRWRAAYGQHAEVIARALRQEPPLDLTAKSDPEDWAEPLLAALTATGALRLEAGHAPVPELPGYQDGAWWVQDAAAALPARMLGDVRAKRVLDLCAAPGGKTLQLAAAGAEITALDISADRLERLRQNLERTGLRADIVLADALNWRPAKSFDAILLDAPCSATGTLRRHPDIAWLRRPADIPKLAQLQAKLLEAAAAMLKPDGTLVYAVCALEPEEGPAIVAAALHSGFWRRVPLAPGEIAGTSDFLTPDGDLRTLPSHWSEIGGLDGFYAARLRLAREAGA